MADQYFEGIGRRKESSARVRLLNGTGQITVNAKTGAAYFTRPGDLEAIMAPFKVGPSTSFIHCSLAITSWL